MSTLLAHVGVRATDLERTIRFWRDALGLQVAATMPGCYDLTDGQHNFRVFQHRAPDGQAPRPAHVGGLLDYLHVGVLVDDLTVTAQRCTQLGFQIIWDGVDGGKAYDPAEPPAESFKVEDPDGIVVDVTASRTQWPGMGDGRVDG